MTRRSHDRIPGDADRWSRWRQEAGRRIAAPRAPGAATATREERIERLERDVDRLTLLAHTVAEAVVRKGVMTRADFQALADEIDLLDGVKDGKVAPGALDAERR